MNANHHKALLLTCLVACVALPADAAERMRPGQWVGEWTGGGRTRHTSTCVTQSDADAINGDVKSVRAYLEQIIPPTICKVTNIKVSGGQIAYPSVCAGKENAITRPITETALSRRTPAAQSLRQSGPERVSKYDSPLLADSRRPRHREYLSCVSTGFARDISAFASRIEVPLEAWQRAA
jgi:hypothetical protein